MSNSFEVNTEGILRSAPGIKDLAGRVSNIYSGLYGTLRSLGEPWGGDATGQAFADNYLSPAEEMLNGIGGMREVLVSTGNGVVTMAEGFQRTELENLGSIEFGPRPGDPTLPHPTG